MKNQKNELPPTENNNYLQKLETSSLKTAKASIIAKIMQQLKHVAKNSNDS